MGSPAATVVYVLYNSPPPDLGWIAPGAHVVVVHNDGRRDTAADADGLHLHPDDNLGFGGGVNLAAEHATGEWLVLVNPDTELDDRHWDALLSGAGPTELVTIPMLDDAGVFTHSVRPYPGPLRHLLGGFRAGRLAPRGSRRRERADAPLVPGERDLTYSLVSHWASGAALAIPTALFRAVGGFDPGYFLYFEDVDLCCRIAEHEPSATIRLKAVPPARHQVGGSATGEVEQIRLRSAVRWSERQRGVQWRLVERLLRVRLRRLRG